MRRQPVAFALVDAAFLADTKWRALRRRLPAARDFNSAVGAWLIALTAARRNGLPGVDAAEEAEDPTFIPDLVAVGLLSEDGIPEKPYREWAPARPKYPSDLAPKVPNAPKTPPTPSDSVSPPLPSISTTKSLLRAHPRARAREEDHPEAWLELGPVVVELTGRLYSDPFSGLATMLVEDAKDFGTSRVIETMRAVAAAMGVRPDLRALAFGVRHALRPPPDAKAVTAAEREVADKRSFERRVEQTQRKIAALKGGRE